MLLLGFFLLIAKYTNLKVGQEGESGGLQRGAELLGKEKKIRREKGVSDKEKYRFKESEIGNSWLLGDDSNNSTNAYVNYMSGCEETLIIPKKITDESENTKKVEVIGQFAFNGCGNCRVNGTTRSIILSRNIKVIKYLGLGDMNDVTSFEIEEGSYLESIESFGLSLMLWEYNLKRSDLVLPSTVTSIAEDGLYYNNLIKTIYYCGSMHLSNYSDLEYEGVSAPEIKVTGSYKYSTIFEKYEPNKTIESITEAEEKCRSFACQPEASSSPFPSPLSPPPPAEECPILSKYSRFWQQLISSNLE